MIDRNRPRSRAWTITSSTIFSVIALPIWTAPPETLSLADVSSAELKVAPWMPSRPVRPPIATIRSPGSTCFAAIPRGRTSDGPAEDQRIGQVAGVHRQCAVDGRDAHAVAVVADARDDPLEDAPGVEHAGREAIRDRVRAKRRRRRRCCRSAWPRGPVPSASRMTPPSPVFAPP